MNENDKKVKDFSEKLKTNLNKAVDGTKEGIKTSEDFLKDNGFTASKTTILTILSLFFPIGGFMLYFQLHSNKRTEKLANTYLTWSIFGVIIWLVMSLIRLFFWFI